MTLFSDVRDLVREIVATPYYRSRPWEVPSLLGARWSLSRAKVGGLEFLKGLNVDELTTLLADFDRRAGLFEEVSTSMARAHSEEGEQGGVSPEDGFILYCLARWARPSQLIETGVAAGVSTTYLMAALADNGTGRMWSIELPPEQMDGDSFDGSTYTWQRHGPGWAIPQSIRDQVGSQWTLLLEDVRSALPRLLKEVRTVDLFFHDDLHTAAHMAWEYELVWPHLTPGGLLVSDDVNHAWVRFCRRHDLADRATANAGRFAALRKPIGARTQ